MGRLSFGKRNMRRAFGFAGKRASNFMELRFRNPQG
jgi:hypothetical protein